MKLIETGRGNEFVVVQDPSGDRLAWLPRTGEMASRHLINGWFKPVCPSDEQWQSEGWVIVN